MLRPYEIHLRTIRTEWHGTAKHVRRARLILQARLTVGLGPRMLRPYEILLRAMRDEWQSDAEHVRRARLIPQARLTVDLGAPYAAPLL